MSRRSAMTALRLALEVDQVDVVLRHQHLAEMVVAVDARLEARRRQVGRGRDAREDRLPRLVQRRGVGLGLAGQARRGARDDVEGARHVAASRPWPSAPRRASVIGSALKARSLGRGGEGGMQLRGAPAEDAAEVERVGERRRARPCRAATAPCASKSTRQRIEHHVPGVALVPHEGEDRRERHRLALRRHVFGRAEEGGRVPEAGRSR